MRCGRSSENAGRLLFPVMVQPKDLVSGKGEDNDWTTDADLLPQEKPEQPVSSTVSSSREHRPCSASSY